MSKVPELQGRYRIIEAERKFIIDKTDIKDDGVYFCVANQKKKPINVVGKYNLFVFVSNNILEITHTFILLFS